MARLLRNALLSVIFASIFFPTVARCFPIVSAYMQGSGTTERYTQTIASNITWIGDNFISSGSLITINNGVSVIINGTLEAGPYQIFNLVGSGQIYFAHNSPGVDTGQTTTDIVYPEWWGAQGNGTHDDTAAINSATYAFERGWGKVLFTGKQYLISSECTISASYTFWEGEIPQWRNTPLPTIVSNSATAKILRIYGAGTDGVVVKGLTFSRSVSGTSGSRTISVEGGLTPKFENCTWADSQYGMYVHAVSGLSIKDCTAISEITGNGTDYGIYIDGTDTDNTGVSVQNFSWLGNTTSDITYQFYDKETGGSAKGAGDRRLFNIGGSGQLNYGVYIEDGSGFSSDVIISGNTWDTILSTGITLKSDAGASFAQQAVISPVWMNLAAVGATGINIVGRDNTAVIGGSIALSDSSENGIVFDGSSYGSWTGVTFSGTASSAVVMSVDNKSGSNSFYNTGSANTFLIPSTITIAANCNTNYFSGNQLTTVTDVGTGNVVSFINSATALSREQLNGASNAGHYLSIGGNLKSGWAVDSGDTYFDYGGSIGRIIFRAGVNGTVEAVLDRFGNFFSSSTVVVPYTKAQLQAKTPDLAYQIVGCSNCTVDTLVVSTGAAKGAWASFAARTTVPN